MKLACFLFKRIEEFWQFCMAQTNNSLFFKKWDNIFHLLICDFAY